MDPAYDVNLLPRILLSLVTVGYGIGLIVADLNRTHATNPDWTGHARFHVVWQVLSYTGFAAIALYLIWMPAADWLGRFYLAAGFAVVIFVSFFLALMFRAGYRGTIYDPNGVQPMVLGGMRVDTNIFVFCVFIVLLLGALLTVSPGPV